MFCRRSIFAIVILSALMLMCLPLYAGSETKNSEEAAGASGTGQKATFTPMPEPGKKVPIGDGYYLIYGFDKQPKIGMAILKIQVYTGEEKKDTSLSITVDDWMPSMPEMKGGHDTCKISKKGDYLVPVRISMTGDWEIKLTIMKDHKVIYRGSYKFDV
jgi:YtkA-like